jgi:hypothetical protein
VARGNGQGSSEERAGAPGCGLPSHGYGLQALQRMLMLLVAIVIVAAAVGEDGN